MRYLDDPESFKKLYQHPLGKTILAFLLRYRKNIKPHRRQLLYIVSVIIIIIAAWIAVNNGASLSGISNLGILMVALTALKITKEQAQEWRRRECSEIFQKCIKNLEEIQEPLAIMINESFTPQSELLPTIYAGIEAPYICEGNKLKEAKSLIENLEHAGIHMNELGKSHPTTTICELINDLIKLNRLIKSNNENRPLDGKYLEIYQETRNRIRASAKELDLFRFSDDGALNQLIREVRNRAITK